jgi:hypothetical protein
LLSAAALFVGRRYLQVAMRDALEGALGSAQHGLAAAE